MFIYSGFFCLLSQMELVWNKCLCQEEQKLYLNMQKVLKYQTTGKGETKKKIKLGKLINYFPNYPQKCLNIYSNSTFL